jgi:aryl-alcohol dehydrogenase-like predicted oxidoreductase
MSDQKIILGTAQLMQGYGTTNSLTPSIQEIEKIFSYAYENGIYQIDTAPEYGESEKIIGQIRSEHLLTTKVPTFQHCSDTYSSWVKDSVERSLQNTHKKHVTNLLFHNTQDMISNFSTELEVKLLELKSAGLVQNIGFSVYDRAELEDAMNLFSPDLIQFPLNPFDQRFLEDNLLKNLHDQGIDLFARSIFLQGILIANIVRNKEHFHRWSGELESWKQFCKNNGYLPYEACIKFIQGIDFLTGYTFGVGSLNELKQVVRAVTLDGTIDCKHFSSSDLDLIDPRRWH